MKRDLIASDQLPSAPGFDLAVDFDLAVLNRDLGLTAGIYESLPFQERIKLDERLIGHLVTLVPAWRASAAKRRARRALQAQVSLQLVSVSRAGSCSCMVVPLPGSLVALIDPPCASTILLAMASPNPDPPLSRERDLSAR